MGHFNFPFYGGDAYVGVINSDLTHTVVIAGFGSDGAAQSYFNNTPLDSDTLAGAIDAYGPAPTPEGIAFPSEAKDNRSCDPTYTFATYSNGKCSEGASVVSVGVDVYVLDGPYVVISQYVHNEAEPAATSADVAQAVPYAQDALNLLSY